MLTSFECCIYLLVLWLLHTSYVNLICGQADKSKCKFASMLCKCVTWVKDRRRWVALDGCHCTARCKYLNKESNQMQKKTTTTKTDRSAVIRCCIPYFVACSLTFSLSCQVKRFLQFMYICTYEQLRCTNMSVRQQQLHTAILNANAEHDIYLHTICKYRRARTYQF